MSDYRFKVGDVVVYDTEHQHAMAGLARNVSPSPWTQSPQKVVAVNAVGELLLEGREGIYYTPCCWKLAPEREDESVSEEQKPYVVKGSEVTTNHDLYWPGALEWPDCDWVPVAEVDEAPTKEGWVRFRTTPSGAVINEHDPEGLIIVRDKAVKPKTLEEKLTAEIVETLTWQDVPNQAAGLARLCVLITEGHFDEKREVIGDLIWAVVSATVMNRSSRHKLIDLIRAELFGEDASPTPSR